MESHGSLAYARILDPVENAFVRAYYLTPGPFLPGPCFASLLSPPLTRRAFFWASVRLQFQPAANVRGNLTGEFHEPTSNKNPDGAHE